MNTVEQTIRENKQRNFLRDFEKLLTKHNCNIHIDSYGDIMIRSNDFGWDVDTSRDLITSNDIKVMV